MATSAALPAPTLTASQIYTGLAYGGYGWTAGQFTYSVPDATSTWAGYDPTDEPFVGYSPLNAGQATAFRAAIAAWDAVIAPNFVETDDHLATGNIRAAFTSYTDDTHTEDFYAFAYRPPSYSGGTAPWQGDVWIAAENKDASPRVGGEFYEVVLHEVGHALGLKHPFDAPILAGAYDNSRYTVMSYTDPDQLVAVLVTPLADGGLQPRYELVLPSTPMVLDIAVAQALYGADRLTAAGNDTYRFSQDAPFLKTLYDAGGIDTLDLSNFTRACNIDLTPGAYSSLGFYSAAQQQADLAALYPDFAGRFPALFADVAKYGIYEWADNFGIALSTVIENAIGGSGADTLTGNAAPNALIGGAGADFIRGLDGGDLVYGGAGNDDVNGNQGNDLVHGDDGADSVRGGQGSDSVYGDAGDDPHVNGNLGDDMVYGGAGNDTVYGGQGSDTLFGEDGNDWLSGDLGSDILIGGAGADRFLMRPGGGEDRVTDFNAADGDRVQLAPGVGYTVISVGTDAAIDLGGGDRLILTGVSIAAMGDWLVVV